MFSPDRGKDNGTACQAAIDVVRPTNPPWPLSTPLPHTHALTIPPLRCTLLSASPVGRVLRALHPVNRRRFRKGIKAMFCFFSGGVAAHIGACRVACRRWEGRFSGNTSLPDAYGSWTALPEAPAIPPTPPITHYISFVFFARDACTRARGRDRRIHAVPAPRRLHAGHFNTEFYMMGRSRLMIAAF